MPAFTHRVRALNERRVRPGGSWVLYWMTSFRRAGSNFALDRAIEHARSLEQPLIVLEALRVGYPWASDRLHTFILQGMAENARRFEGSAVTYVPYVETEKDEGKGLVEALAAKASVIVVDDWPCFFVPHMQAALASRVEVLVESVDSNGLYPMHETQRVFSTAHSFRTHLQKSLAPFLTQLPVEHPLDGLTLPKADVPRAITSRWSRAPKDLLAANAEAIAALPIDHSVPAVAMVGGSAAAEARMQLFVSKKLDHYADARSEPEVDGTSALSPYLHFGHLSVHQVFRAITHREKWSAKTLGKSVGGAKEGWWQLAPSTEAFIDELVTWRELAFNMSSHRPDAYAALDSLPQWALATHQAHAHDVRETVYSREAFETAQTHDPLWNATQRQLVRDGWFHNYLRMLWGKKILQWSKTPQEALDTMEHLMNKYSLDGRDPVSYSGFLWVLGRYDRAWGPERKIFGKVRYMSSDNTAKKISVKGFLKKYGP
jgi:deoxyribodipyrimidine photo-lyase